MTISGTFNLNGALNQGLSSSITTSNLNIFGAYNLTNGSLTVVSNEILGGSSATSVFDQQGGSHSAGQLQIAGNGVYNLSGGQLGGAVTVSGGTFIQTGGDFSPSVLNVPTGSMVQDGGTGTIGPATLGIMTMFPTFPTTYTVSNGTPVFSSGLTINSTGLFDQEGGSNTVNGTLSVQSDTSSPGTAIQGTFTLNDGVLWAQAISIEGNFNQSGGTNHVSGNATLTGANFSLYNLLDGLLVTANTTMLDGRGNFIQSGGQHLVSGTLRVGGTAGPAYALNGGQLSAPTIAIAGGATFQHTGGTVTNTTLLQLNGTWSEYAGNQQFGQLQVVSFGGTLLFGANSAILHFADSSGQAWSGGILTIRNWSGSINGGGANQVVFGNSAAGLTPTQVGQIQFVFNSSTTYPAKILSTGEVVPDASGVPYAPSNLSAQGVSSNQINLTWTDNSLGEIGFKVDRSTDGTNFVQIATPPADSTNYSDVGLTPMKAYFYRVRAYNVSGDSFYTSTAEASTKWTGAAPLPGMVAWWPAENSADDVIGVHNGTTPYGIGYAAGESGQAFDFDASNRRVFVPDSSDFVPTNGFTFEGWFYARQTLDSYLGMRGDDRGGLDSWAVRRTSDGQLAFQVDDVLNNFAVISTPVQNNQWNHFAATFDVASGAMKLYLNGTVAVQTNTTIVPIGAYDPGWNPGIGIGNQSGTITRTSFDGLIDDAAVYSRALSASEIQSIYSSGAAGKAGLIQAPPVPPRLSLKPQSGGMQLTIGGVAGSSYEVQTSTNLKSWVVWTQVDSTGTNSIIDTNSATVRRNFYRVRLLP